LRQIATIAASKLEAAKEIREFSAETRAHSIDRPEVTKLARVEKQFIRYPVSFVLDLHQVLELDQIQKIIEVLNERQGRIRESE